MSRNIYRRGVAPVGVNLYQSSSSSSDEDDTIDGKPLPPPVQDRRLQRLAELQQVSGRQQIRQKTLDLNKESIDSRQLARQKALLHQQEELVEQKQTETKSESSSEYTSGSDSGEEEEIAEKVLMKPVFVPKYETID